jgi:hypothetical protein
MNVDSAPRAEFSQSENILTSSSTRSPQGEASSSLPSNAGPDAGGEATFAQNLASDFSSTGGAASTEQPQASRGLPDELALRNPPNRSDALGQISTLTQRLNTSVEAAPDKGRGKYPSNLGQLVDGKSLYGGQKPSVNSSTVPLRNYQLQPNKSDDDKKFLDRFSGSKQGGLVPKKAIKAGKTGDDLVPETANYQERRPEQLLSHMSSVMKWSAEQNGKDPVEVQFGYAPTPNGPKIYSSTNNRESQDWLSQALSDPLSHVKNAAKNSQDPDVKRNANKLLFFDENQAARRQQLGSSSLSPEKKQKLSDDLDLTDKIHSQMFTGTHNVVKTDKLPTPADAKRPQRHAEQNVAAAMHQDGATGTAEIAGTKIRCYSCSASIGPSLKDETEKFTIAGRVYTSQSSQEATKRLGRSKGTTKVHTGPSGRSKSSSPARFSAEDQAAQASSSKRPRPDDFDAPAQGEASQTEAFKRLRLDPTTTAAG